MKNRTLKIILIIFLSILVIALSIFFINILANKDFKFINLNFGYRVSNELVFSNEYETIFENIKINSQASDIEIKRGNDYRVKVVIYGDKKQTKVKTSDNKLDIISSGKNCVGVCFNMTILKIKIYLPVNYSGNIRIVNNYGDVGIDKFNNLNLDAELDLGDIEADSLASGKIKSAYGDIRVSGHSKSLEIEEDCGDIEVATVDRIKVKNAYGDIKIQTVNEYLNIKEDCGDIEIDFIKLQENSTINNNYGDIEIGLTNDIHINAKTNLGDIKLNNNYPKSDVTLNINNSCGDIEVNN